MEAHPRTAIRGLLLRVRVRVRIRVRIRIRVRVRVRIRVRIAVWFRLRIRDEHRVTYVMSRARRPGSVRIGSFFTLLCLTFCLHNTHRFGLYVRTSMHAIYWLAGPNPRPKASPTPGLALVGHWTALEGRFL